MTVTIKTVGDLRDYLEEFEDDQPVMIAHQESWPLAEVVRDIRTVEPEEVVCEEHPDYLVGHTLRDADGNFIGLCPWQPEEDEEDPANQIVWIVAGGHHWDLSPYAPREVFNR